MPRPPPRTDSVDALIGDAKRAALELAVLSTRISQRLIERADAAAKDPSGTARNAARKAAAELDKARKGIEQALEQLK